MPRLAALLFQQAHAGDHHAAVAVPDEDGPKLDELRTMLAELKAAAQGIDDEGMQEANPNLHMRRVAEEIWSILEMVG